MKIAVLAALHRSGVDLDTAVPLRNSFTSALRGAPPYGIEPDHEVDGETWALLGRRVSLRRLAELMVAHSSDLAANTLIAHVGVDAVDEIWRLAGAERSRTRRAIGDFAARRAGVTNLVTAADLVRLLCWLPRPVLERLTANTHRGDLAAGLPAGTWIAFKNGWISGVRHCAAVVRPDDAPPYAVAVCYTGPLASGEAVGDPAARLLARVSGRVWSLRHPQRNAAS